MEQEYTRDYRELAAFDRIDEFVLKNIETYIQSKNLGGLIDLSNHKGTARALHEILSTLQILAKGGNKTAAPMAIALIGKFIELSNQPLPGTLDIEKFRNKHRGNKFVRGLMGSMLNMANYTGHTDKEGFVKSDPKEELARYNQVVGNTDTRDKGLIHEILVGYVGGYQNEKGIGEEFYNNYEALLKLFTPLIQIPLHKENDKFASQHKKQFAIDLLKEMTILIVGTPDRALNNVNMPTNRQKFAMHKQDGQEALIDYYKHCTELVDKIDAKLIDLVKVEGKLDDKEDSELNLNDQRRAPLQRCLVETRTVFRKVIDSQEQSLGVKGGNRFATNKVFDVVSTRNLLQQPSDNLNNTEEDSSYYNDGFGGQF